MRGPEFFGSGHYSFMTGVKMEKLIEKAKVLIEALPYIRRFRGGTMVVKYGGAAMASKDLRDLFAQDTALLRFVGIQPVVVHGGGPHIKAVLDRLGIESIFKDGLRVTDPQTLEVVEMVLGGPVNSGIVELISRHGVKAVGLTGKDGYLLEASKYMGPDGLGGVDYGLVGDVERVNPDVLESLINDFVPVIAPLGVGEDGTTYNINADTVAGRIAGSLKASKLVILTDQEGIVGPNDRLLRSVTASEIKRYIEDGTISGGMLPKVQSCLQALSQGVGKAHIIDGRVEHCLLLEIFTTSGVGTQILPDVDI